jgi:hypothetical protein
VGKWIGGSGQHRRRAERGGRSLYVSGRLKGRSLGGVSIFAGRMYGVSGGGQVSRKAELDMAKMPFTFMIVHCSRLKQPGYFITTLCSPAALRHLESNTWSVNHSCDHNQCRVVTVLMTDDDGGTKQSSVLHGLQQRILSFTYLASSRTVKKSYT